MERARVVVLASAPAIYAQPPELEKLAADEEFWRCLAVTPDDQLDPDPGIAMPPTSYADSVTYYIVASHRVEGLKAWWTSLPPRAEDPDENHYAILTDCEMRLGQLALATISHELTIPCQGSGSGTEYYVEKYGLADTEPRYDPTDYIDRLCGGTTLVDFPCIVVQEHDAKKRIRLLQLMRALIAQRMIPHERDGMAIALAAIEAMPDDAVLVSWDEQGA